MHQEILGNNPPVKLSIHFDPCLQNNLPLIPLTPTFKAAGKQDWDYSVGAGVEAKSPIE